MMSAQKTTKIERGKKVNVEEDELQPRVWSAEGCDDPLGRKIADWEKHIKKLQGDLKEVENTKTKRGSKEGQNSKKDQIMKHMFKIQVLISDTLKQMVGDRDVTIEELETTAEELEATVEEKDDTIEKQNEIIADLQRRDNYHDGPNTPPSKDSMTRQQSRKNRKKNRKPSGKKQGAQPGHKGAGRKRSKPTKLKDVKAEKCPECGSKNLTVTKEDIKDMTQIVTHVETTRYHIKTCKCEDCGKDDITKKANIPKNGTADTGLIKEISECHHNRMPIAKIRKRLMRQNVFLSDGTIQNIIAGMSSITIPISEKIKQIIRNCDILCIDETSVRYNNKLHWLWIFLDPQTGITFYTIDLEHGRGRDVLKNVLGPNWNGTIVCDGWTAYTSYKIQRCNAHLIRGLDNIVQKNSEYKIAKRALSTLRRIYHDAKQILDQPARAREKYKKKFESRMRRLVRRYADDPIIGEYMAKLGRAIKDMFKFVIDPRIPPTNNAAEAGLREFVIQRRIRGAIRSEESLTLIPARLTCTTTWQNTGKNPIEEMMKLVPMI